jgi:biotin carboxyl carrier protein
MKYIAEIDGLEFRVEVLDEHHIQFGDQVLDVDFSPVSGQPLYSLILDGKSYEAFVYPEENSWKVLLLGRSYSVIVEDEREKKTRAIAHEQSSGSGEYILKAPMPGLIVSVPVSEGQAVEKGQTLAILESMKMQNELKSPRSGNVKRMSVKPGDNVEQKQILLSIG